jgi:hypothetical protein
VSEIRIRADDARWIAIITLLLNAGESDEHPDDDANNKTPGAGESPGRCAANPYPRRRA